MINNNNLVSSQSIRPVQMLEPQHLAIEIEPDTEASQENALLHPSQALQSQKRPALAKQLAEKLQNGTARLANGVMYAINTAKDNPKAALGAATAGTLTLLGGAAALANSAVSSHLHHAMRSDDGFGGSAGGGSGGSGGSSDSGGGSGINDAATAAALVAGAATILAVGCYAAHKCGKEDD